jgi:TrmH family RNA methyltransferase
MISSLRNERVRYVQSLQTRRRIRQRERRMVLEGARLVEESVRAGLAPSFVFYTERATEGDREGSLLDTLGRMGVPSFPVTETVLNACSDTATPQPIMAVLRTPDLPRPAQPSLTLVVDAIRDPGNLGTTLRTALAADVEQVVLAPGTVDATSPKVVRSAMGAHLHLPIITLRWPAIAESFQEADVWLAAASAGVDYTTVDWTRPVALIIGGEAAGAGERARELAGGCVSIPIAGTVESLNSATAAAVILFEIRRQRCLRNR